MGERGREEHLQANNRYLTLYYLTCELHNIVDTENIKYLDITVCGICIPLSSEKLKYISQALRARSRTRTSPLVCSKSKLMLLNMILY